MKAIKEFLRRLFCKHDFSCYEYFQLERTNVIVMEGYRCSKCGKTKIEFCTKRAPD